jgi:enoyl-CoA hydratase
MRHALQQEWRGSKAEVTKGVKGAGRFAGGKGRGGDFNDV